LLLVSNLRKIIKICYHNQIMVADIKSYDMSHLLDLRNDKITPCFQNG